LAAIVFLALNLIQFLIGSYLEPRIAGAALALSPFVVLFAVFFWGLSLGHPGRVYRRAHRDRSTYAVRTTGVHAMDRGASGATRASLMDARFAFYGDAVRPQ
jgi:hypothetical protein